MSFLKSDKLCKFEIAKANLTKIRNSEYMPSTAVTSTGYGHKVVNIVNSKNGAVQKPRISYEVAIASAKAPNIHRKK